MGKSIDELVLKLEELGTTFVKGFQLIGSSGPFGNEVSFPQYLILQTLLEKEALRMNELASALGVSKANVTGLVDRMVRSRLIERMRSDEDRRVVFVRLSPRGQRVAQKLVNNQRKEWKRIMESIPPKDLEGFMNSLEHLASALAIRNREANASEEV